ncbi:MAG: sulfite exporter TauE/SafE family protein [Chitinophagaceae bacterium]|nr:sulfite exporter TauE/SafE family protein [Chitinophagaceae bacterium]
MWPYLTAGLALGILGSFHCVGMCGPLALSLPLKMTTYGRNSWGADCTMPAG